ncbi:chorismate--pyruvate lyase family protein [Azohydromonas aeria]|uniref:chorismate--pyruvate lyase family protein n=1 Tax=Azohydromonas aeria TaxID=2590212 RepID=UPI0012F8C825|nr:chorismate lyase [Azohydromonas aeria]
MSLALRRWQRAPGSLTARLKALGERFEVRTLRQRVAPLLPEERCVLGAGRHLVREVVLCVDGVPLVWARSVAPARTLRGPWRALAGLGTRPLGQLLFDDARVARSALVPHHWHRGHPGHGRVRRDWLTVTGADWPAAVVAGRSSVFKRRGAKLRVFEAFAPELIEFASRTKNQAAGPEFRA